MKKIIIMLFFISVLAFSKDFWELSSFNVNVKETTSSSKVKTYSMSYNSGTLKVVISSP